MKKGKKECRSSAAHVQYMGIAAMTECIEFNGLCLVLDLHLNRIKMSMNCLGPHKPVPGFNATNTSVLGRVLIKYGRTWPLSL